MPPAPARRPDRSLSWLPIAGAAVIAVLAVVAIILVGSGKDTRLGLRTDDAGALSCPDTYRLRAVTDVPAVPRAWVPIVPTGVDGTEHLVADAKPQHVTVCRYPGGGASLSAATDLRLGGSTTVTGNAHAMTTQLSKLAKASSYAGAPTTCSGPGTTYLVGFVFPTGAEWVAVPGTTCQRVTNGVYDTATDLGTQVAAAFTSRSWG